MGERARRENLRVSFFARLYGPCGTLTRVPLHACDRDREASIPVPIEESKGRRPIWRMSRVARVSHLDPARTVVAVSPTVNDMACHHIHNPMPKNNANELDLNL
jgi:hypothetical protein